MPHDDFILLEQSPDGFAMEQIARGEPGPQGADGVSPAVTITKITGGHRVTITDAEHPQGQSFDVPDGEALTVDDELSNSSANPVQNKAIYAGILKAFPTAAASGSVASFDDGTDGLPLKKLVVNIEPAQSGSGDPSPDNVRPITGWAGCNVARTGKNLFGGTYGAPEKYPLPRGADSITVSAKSTGDYKLTLRYYGSDGVRRGVDSTIVDIRKTESTIFSDVPDEATQFILFFSSGGSASDFWDVQVELGYTATAYEPYQSNTYSITFPSPDPGTVYGGTLDAVSGKLTIDRYGKKIKDFNWSYAAGASRFESIPSPAVKRAVQNNILAAGLMCECYKSAAATGMPNECIGVLTSQKVIIKDNRYTTVSAFTAAMGEYLIVYPLAEPIVYQVYQIEPHTIVTLLGTNNIWADTGNVSVEYRADTKLYISKRLTAVVQMLGNIESGMTASKAYAVNDFLTVNNQLYIVTAPIASGGTITPGTNVTATTVGAQLTGLVNS